MNNSALLESSVKQHVMLLYENLEHRNNAELEAIKEALNKGQFCVYASIDMNDKGLLRSFISKIPNCDELIEQGNLLITNFKPYYESALQGRLEIFEELRNKIETIIAHRTSKGKNATTFIVADAACHLVKNGHIGKSARLEKWWQDTYRRWIDKGLDVSIICSHPAQVLRENAHNQDSAKISHNHSLVLDVEDVSTRKSPMPPKNEIRILVAEPDEDISNIYEWYFEGLPVRAEVVRSGNQCIDKIVPRRSDLEEEKENSTYDVVILDAHLRDTDAVALAQKVLNKFPNQRIIFTSSNEELSRLQLASNLQQSSNMKLLAKPFDFGELVALLKTPDI